MNALAPGIHAWEERQKRATGLCPAIAGLNNDRERSQGVLSCYHWDE